MSRQTISLPGLYDLDITSIVPILQLPQMQRLRWIKQLGAASFVFVGSSHTRFDHCLYVYSVTQERTKRWAEDGVITTQEARALELYALLHDVGHCAYSHTLESLCPQDHNAQGIMLLHSMRQAIAACGADPDMVIDIMSRKNPLHVCVSHRPLGTDKLAYLLLDSRNTTEQVGLRMGSLLNYVTFTNGTLAVNPAIIPETLIAWSEYVEMYTQVYCKKAALICHSFLEQIVDRAMHFAVIGPSQLQGMSDLDLAVALSSWEDNILRSMFLRFINREWPKSAIEIRPSEVDPLLRVNGKPAYICAAPTRNFIQLPDLEHPGVARMWEGKIASILGIPEHEVLIVPPVPMKRLLPDDVAIFEGATPRGTLQDARPWHWNALVEKVTAFTALRVCVPAEHRVLAAKPKTAQRICSLLLNN